MKALGHVAVVGSLAAVTAAGMLPAKAASYTIAAGHWSGLSAAAAAFIQQKCPADFVGSPLNGTDARVVDVGGFQGTNINVPWGGTVATGGGMSARMFGASCDVKPAGNVASFSPGGWVLHVPLGTKWMVVEPSRAAQISFDIHPA